MVHDWEYERASAEYDAFEAWALGEDLDLDAPATRVAYDAYVQAEGEAYAEDQAEARRDDALLPW